MAFIGRGIRVWMLKTLCNGERENENSSFPIIQIYERLRKCNQTTIGEKKM